MDSLAMAEMTVLCAALYREYNTTIAPGFEDTSPAITARVETFYDERFPKVKVCQLLNSLDAAFANICQESTCLVKFEKLKR